MKQIILITDGCSNVGISPVVAAAHARQSDIVVNVIGIVDGGDLGERGATEIAEIAKAGGGMSRLVTQYALAETVQMMTRQTVLRTIRQTVQQELKQIIGPGAALEQLPPGQRGAVVRMIDEWSETSSLRVALLIDTSASMAPKLKAVEEACRDLLASLRARKGVSEMAVFRFPGHAEVDLLADWTSDLAKTANMFYNLNMKGTTPTGPALLGAIRYVAQDTPAHSTLTDGAAIRGRDEERSYKPSDGDGIFSDYIV
ncbi:VWA domain-containing protein [Paenibacillus ginsengarvi]|uniref:VWA domain-containing protein n=1 Tax=Paenibacillus ginsengarvi TaxID=400777 RepID=A0A3B0B2C4_9BACL|nr:VWA domain-containing protein [Paenibacillus ginsengarvi]RKN65757.1 VWA domain-containing protein [Paenibacillus ginsengarvi]